MSSFKFSLISDMHVDFPQEKTPYDKLEEFVVVAGDTSNGLLGTKFINKLKNKGHEVFAVDGNHEHYSNLNQGRTPGETEAQFYQLIGGGASRLLPDNLLMVGSNGWYLVQDGSLWSGYMNDSRLCSLSPSEVNHLAMSDAKYLRDQVSEHEGPVIVVTHTAPCLDTLNPTYDGHYSNEWYWNPLMSEIIQQFSDKILVWCHGHTHASADKVVEGVRVVCNPRGYPGENPSWAPQTIEVSW